jgi:hypothetical protein
MKNSLYRVLLFHSLSTTFVHHHVKLRTTLPGRGLSGSEVLLDVRELGESCLPGRKSREGGGHILTRARLDRIEDVKESDLSKGELRANKEAAAVVVLEQELLKAPEPAGDDLLGKVLLKSLLVLGLGPESLSGGVRKVLNSTLELIDFTCLNVIGAVETKLASKNAKDSAALPIVLPWDFDFIINFNIQHIQIRNFPKSSSSPFFFFFFFFFPCNYHQSQCEEPEGKESPQ